MEFSSLINSIKETHFGFQLQAVKAVNLSLTIRNWLIGFYIVEFEQKGKERAKYGDKLLNNLAESVQIEGLSVTTLKLNRQFFLTYPQMIETLPLQLKKIGLESTFQISQTLPDQLQVINKEIVTISQALPDQSLLVPIDLLISKLSFTHFVELVAITDTLKRTFYEIECIKANWSTRELKRQINTLYFERSGISLNKEKLSYNKNLNLFVA